MLSVTLRQLDYACAIARQGGLTAASEALHVSQPALSVALGQIEAQLGQALFLRRPGGPMVPTAFGRAWLAEAERQLAGIAQLMAGRIAAAPLRLAVFEDLAPLVLGPLLARAEVAIAPMILGFEALLRALAEGQADAGLTWDLGLAPQMARREICRLPPRALLAADHRLAGRQSLTLADLAEEPLVLTDQGLSIAHMRALFSRAGLAARIAHRCASLDLMRSFAANGLGVGLSYTQPAPRLSPDGRALVVLPLGDAGTEPVILAWPGAGTEPAGLEALHGLIQGLMPVG